MIITGFPCDPFGGTGKGNGFEKVASWTGKEGDLDGDGDGLIGRGQGLFEEDGTIGGLGKL